MELENTEIKLYPHQVESIKNMEQFEQTKTRVFENKIIKSKIGINSDLTGYGKTISIIGLIVRDRMYWNFENETKVKDTFVYVSGLITKTISYKKQRLYPTLILVGPSMIKQWLDEFKKTNLDVCSIISEKSAKSVDVNEYDVILIVPRFIREFHYRYRNFVWKRFVYDEPSNIVLPANVEIKAGFTWFLTATPNLIYTFQHKKKNTFMKNICRELYSFVDLISIKNDDDFVRESFVMPKTNFFVHVCISNVYKVIYNLVDERTQQLIEMGNIEKAIEHMGGKSTSNIIEVVQDFFSNEHRKIKHNLKFWQEENDIKKIEKYKKEEELLLSKIKNLEERIKTILVGKCCICFEDLNNPLIEPNCKNVFCGSCLFDWLKNKNNCPLCRNIIEVKNLVHIKKSEEEKTKEWEKKCDKKNNKEEQIFEIFSRKKNSEGQFTGKFIIYSDDSSSFHKIRTFLDDNKIDFIEMKGHVTTRYKSICKFKEEDIFFVAFLNSIKDCSGVNMQETTDVIFYHEVNEDIKTQVIGRANRIGRKEELNVHELILEK